MQHAQRLHHRQRNAVLYIGEDQRWACYYCRLPGEGEGDWRGPDRRLWVLEHKTPLSRGGDSERENLCVACARCNNRKRKQTAEEFLATMVWPAVTAGALDTFALLRTYEDQRHRAEVYLIQLADDLGVSIATVKRNILELRPAWLWMQKRPNLCSIYYLAVGRDPILKAGRAKQLTLGIFPESSPESSNPESSELSVGNSARISNLPEGPQSTVPYKKAPQREQHTCALCGGVGFRIIERSGLTGAEFCVCHAARRTA